MEPKTNYTVVGLTVLLLIVGLVLAGLWLSIGFDKSNYNFYTVYMSESVSGLTEESLVKFNGVKVGFVDHIELNPVNPQQVKLRLKIEEGTPITHSTRATLITQGITGTTYLGLSAISSSLLPLQKKPGEPYPVIPTKPSFFNELEQTIHEVSEGFKRVVSKENAENLRKSLISLERITRVIARNDANINKTLREFPKLVQNFTVMTQDLSEAGKYVSSTMKAGKVGINKISQQTLPPIILLLRKLDLISSNLEKVSAQIRQNPAVILRGSTTPKLGPGE
ncbi:ABC transport system periplasmic substrate binding protein (plasmid) [Legionella adelaidensis]|uniref:ABC transport system periplasmic substrate binding protein n=1 Tax=Legionella adelaidensis TaxID=45056 RepID=A0A0W0R036_9GAMM|nr:MlaD family protein [Legionella adelaidensis]KTC64479.1 ABC transport system periplasmic substrate binding protein [Legionella adelaidensis]VEH85847.1 ABC transport system periplasmic substrate binding protein [Legionella adelaidensis]